MKKREWYEKKLEGYSADAKDNIRLLLDIRELLVEISDKIKKTERKWEAEK